MKFGPEKLTEADAGRLAGLDAAEKARKAARKAAKGPNGEPAEILNVSARGRGAEGPPMLRIAEGPALSKVQKSNARRAAINWLDSQFKDGGVYAGMFSDKGIQELIDGGMDEYTSRILFDYVGQKIQSLGRDTVEFLSG
jgi:hypothetical protein